MGSHLTAALAAGRYTKVATFADLPPASDHSGEVYVVLTSTGVIFVNRKRAGLYLSNGSTWSRLGTFSGLEDHSARHTTSGDLLYTPRTYVWFVKGDIATGTEQGPTLDVKRAMTVEDIELYVKTAPTGADLIVDINEDGVSIFSTNPEIDIGGTVDDDNHVISDSAIAAGSKLTMDIDQIGSGVAGADLTVLLHCKEAVI